MKAMRPESRAGTFITCSFCDHRPLKRLYSKVRPRLWLTESMWLGQPGVTCKLSLCLPKNFNQKNIWRE